MSKRVTNEQLMERLDSIEKNVIDEFKKADLSTTLYFAVALSVAGIAAWYALDKLVFLYITIVGFAGAVVIGFLLYRIWKREKMKIKL